MPGELLVALANISSPGMITDVIAGHLNIPLTEKQELLETLEVKARLAKLGFIVTRELEVIEIGQKIQSEVQTEMAKGQREFILRQQMKAIQRELGEEGEEAIIRELGERITAVQMPPDVEKVAKHELERLHTIPPASPERTVVVTYLDWLTSLPWAITTEDTLDTVHAQAVLDEDHFDLERVKERVLEFLAVRQLRPDSKGPILCLAGPPGTGKTSLGRSIARALGRKFVRISLGGVRDEAEIRGHRRTYVGALPGRIIQAMRQAKSRNPVFILDEIDKLGMDFRGDPGAALLEVLDPEQNATFVDHYLDVPFDLSSVMFITTANFLVPAGAIAKDGPSAGVAMVVALISLLTNTRAKAATAMTGEITLRGKVLPVGGIKEKVLAAGRAGITTVILPRHNEKDLVDVPKEIREKISFVFVDEIQEVISAALERSREGNGRKEAAYPF